MWTVFIPLDDAGLLPGGVLFLVFRVIVAVGVLNLYQLPLVVIVVDVWIVAILVLPYDTPLGIEIVPVSPAAFPDFIIIVVSVGRRGVVVYPLVIVVGPDLYAVVLIRERMLQVIIEVSALIIMELEGLVEGLLAKRIGHAPPALECGGIGVDGGIRARAGTIPGAIAGAVAARGLGLGRSISMLSGIV